MTEGLVSDHLVLDGQIEDIVILVELLQSLSLEELPHILAVRHSGRKYASESGFTLRDGLLCGGRRNGHFG